MIQYLVNKEVEEILLHEKERIEYHLVRDGVVPDSNYLFKIAPAGENYEITDAFKDTVLFEAYADKRIPYRTFSFSSTIDSQPVRISLKHALLEINELIWLLFLSTSLIILFLVTGLFFINRKIYSWAWNPFFKNLSRLKKYGIAQKEPIDLGVSKITEFEELNQVVAALMDQVRKDFQNLKEFNENISHEIQTPLAVIRNKIVLLLESKNMDEKERERVQAVYQEINKLSKIGKSLTLISRIENQEFKRQDSVNVGGSIENILNNMEEIIKFKQIDVSTDLQPATVECDHILADILFTNLIKNAVQHNTEGGSINIRLTPQKLEITNSGENIELPPERLFSRFQKGNPAKDSLGLGLAINQKICEIYGFRLDYSRNDDMHTFSLNF
jgi:signal transduction histidine kinase